MTDQLDRPKAALADRYKIERHLGEGGMATVCLAQDLKHQRKVAVKVLRPEITAAGGSCYFRLLSMEVRTMRSVMPILCAALLALPSATLGQASPDAQAAIAEANAAWEAAWNAGDGAGIAALYTDDAMLLPPGGEPIEGREAIQAFWQTAVESGTQAALKTSELEIHGDLATEVGSYVDTGADGAHVDHGKYMVMWKKVDGNWKLHRDIWNSSMTP